MDGKPEQIQDKFDNIKNSRTKQSNVNLHYHRATAEIHEKSPYKERSLYTEKEASRKSLRAGEVE